MATGPAPTGRAADGGGENGPPLASAAAARRAFGAGGPRPPLRTIQPPAVRAGGGASMAKPAFGVSLLKLPAASGLRLSTARAQWQRRAAAATERIRVSVRPRPVSAEEARRSPWRVSGNAIALAEQPSVRFNFDRIFAEDCRTEEVYQEHTKGIVEAVVRGFNGTVFAYGQTNSGKTYTMRGCEGEPGVIPLAVRDLFQQIQEGTDREFVVRMSYVEIYNETINDLLVQERRNLMIQESKEGVILVGGLKEETVTCPEQVMNFMLVGESHRHIGETNMNLNSSQSHTIIRLVIQSRGKADDCKVGGSCDALRVSVLNLVDLAGSESVQKTGANGARLKEGSKINTSLMALGNVIEKLSEGIKGQGGHIPYRDSKLTRILQPALGGNANTAIICNITLSQVHADETKNSLQFASRALRVTNCVCVNEILKKTELSSHPKKEIEELREQLAVSKGDEHWKEVLNLQNKLQKAELEKEKISLELKAEKKIKEEQAKRIENLTSLVLNSERDEKNTILTKVSSPIKEGPTSCVNRHEQNMEMPPPFKGLMQGCYANDCEPYANASFSTSKDDAVSLPYSHDLPHVTRQSKSNANPAVEAVKPAPLVEDTERHSEELKQSSLEQDIRVEQSDVKMAEAHSSDEGYWPKSIEFEKSNASEKLKRSNVSEEPELYGSSAGSVQSEFESDEQVSHTIAELVIEVVNENELPPVAPVQDRMSMDYARASSDELRKLRSRNHYKGPRTATDRRLWSIEQQDLYTHIYSKAKLADMKWISWENISPVRERCARLGLEKIMSYCCDWDGELIRQFYSTVYISADKTSLTWMTDGRRITTKKRAWEEMFGVPRDIHTEIHSMLFLKDDDKRMLYKDAECTLGSLRGLSVLASTVNKIIRKTIYPRHIGSMIHKHNWNLLHHIVEENAFDIISLIFGEIDLVIWDRSHTKDLLYAPYIMGMILKAFGYDVSKDSMHYSYKPRNNLNKLKLSKKFGNLEGPLEASIKHEVNIEEAVDKHHQFEVVFENEGLKGSRNHPNKLKLSKKLNDMAAPSTLSEIAPPVAAAPLKASLTTLQPCAASVKQEVDVEAVEEHQQFGATSECEGLKVSRHHDNKLKLPTKVKPSTPAPAPEQAPVEAPPLEAPLSAFKSEAATGGHEYNIEAVDARNQFEARDHPQVLDQPMARSDVMQVVEGRLRPIRDTLASIASSSSSFFSSFF